MKDKDLEKIGLEKLLELHHYTKEDFKFVGRVYNLINDKCVTWVGQYNDTCYIVDTREGTTLDDCIKLLKKHGFPEYTDMSTERSTDGNVLQRTVSYRIDKKAYAICIRMTELTHSIEEAIKLILSKGKRMFARKIVELVKDFSEYDTRRAIARMIDSGEIEVGWDRKARLANIKE